MPSDFYGWTAWDEIAHLCYFDETALLSAHDPERFAADARVLNERVAGGEEMSARSFATARLTETWAHGQDIWDMLRRRRPASNRLKHIAHLGVTTLGWTFVNRGLPVPPVSPYLFCLDAPDGSPWIWGDAASPHQVLGSAQDFCLLVTQRRHVDDTALKYTPGSVSDWLHIAQCFAGLPADGPRPGERKAVV